MKKKVICVDLDGTLCVGVCWNKTACLQAVPVQSVIDRVNKLYQHNFIIIYTARRDNLIPVTLEWLRRNNVLFHAFSNFKVPADLYIDDLSVNPNTLHSSDFLWTTEL